MRFSTGVFVFILLICGVYSQNILQDLVRKLTNNSNNEDLEEARKKKKGKYILPLLFGALMIKSILFPLAIKAMAVMTGVAVFLSSLSLILSSIVAFAKLALKGPISSLKILHKHPFSWAKDDENVTKNYYTLQATDYDSYLPPMLANQNQYV